MCPSVAPQDPYFLPMQTGSSGWYDKESSEGGFPHLSAQSKIGFGCLSNLDACPRSVLDNTKCCLLGLVTSEGHGALPASIEPLYFHSNRSCWFSCLWQIRHRIIAFSCLPPSFSSFPYLPSPDTATFRAAGAHPWQCTVAGGGLWDLSP